MVFFDQICMDIIAFTGRTRWIMKQGKGQVQDSSEQDKPKMVPVPDQQ